MYDYQQAKAEKQQSEYAGDGKVCRRRKAKRDAERVDKVVHASAEHKKQVQGDQAEN